MYYSPVRHSPSESKLSMLPFDLHVLGMPPAFNLSQDQTLHLNPAFWSYSNHSQKLTEINLNHFFGLKSEYFRFFLRFHEETAFFRSTHTYRFVCFRFLKNTEILSLVAEGGFEPPTFGL